MKEEEESGIQGSVFPKGMGNWIHLDSDTKIEAPQIEISIKDRIQGRKKRIWTAHPHLQITNKRFKIILQFIMQKQGFSKFNISLAITKSPQVINRNNQYMQPKIILKLNLT